SRGEVLGQPGGGALAAGVDASQFAHQITGVDAYRAALGAQAGRRTGIEALVFVGALKLSGIDAGAFLRLDIAPDDDALAWRQGQSVGRAHRFAETAFDTFIDDLVGGR